MVNANFSAYRTFVTDSLYQWDLNQVLTVTGLNLSVAPEVHFSNCFMEKALARQATLSGGAISVKIPNSLLQYPYNIDAHIGIYEGETFKVIELVKIPVMPRTRPADYQIEDSDEEIYSFNKLENMIENLDKEWRTENEAHVRVTVTDWLNNHPEATTTVQDESLTIGKFVIGALGYVSPEMFGAIGDGVNDDTAAVAEALSVGTRVVFENGNYLVSDGLDIPSDIVIELKNSKIISNATENKKYIFDIQNKSNIKIIGYNSELAMTKPETAQQACIYIGNSENILVTGLTLSKAGGDGIIIGGTDTVNSKNIEVANCIIDDNRRNGISVIGGVDGVIIRDCIIQNTNGTDPQLGIDIETWDSAYINKNISVYNNRFDNNGNGDLTIFEYTNGVRIYNNHFRNGVSVKVNSDYVGNIEANPTDISFHNNIFESNHYFYGIVYGGFSVLDNVYNGGKISIESPVSVSAEDIADTKSKLIKGNTFNAATTPIMCGYNANLIICENIINGCGMFLSAWGLFNSTIKGNMINGYNVSETAISVFEFNGKVENVIVEDNRIIADGSTNSVSQCFYFKGGSTFDNVIRYNDLSKAAFEQVIVYGNQNNNIDYANVTPTCDNYVRALPTPSKKFAGMILSLVGESSIYTYICTLIDGSYKWKDITSKL